MKYGLVQCVYWDTFEDGEEGFDYKYRVLVEKVFDTYKEAQEFAVEYAKNNGWNFEFVGDDYIYKIDNINDVADISFVECENIDDLKEQISFWG